MAPPIQFGLGLSLARAGGAALDADAAAYIAAVEFEDGQALESGVRKAINNFVVGCKVDGIWSAIKASCILAGARTLDGALVPLVGTAPTNNNFVSGDYDRETGLVGNGITKSIATGRNGQDDPQNNAHACAYYTTAATGGTLLGAGGGQSGATSMGAYTGSSRSRTSTNYTPSATGFTGFFGISRNNSANYDYRRVGSSQVITQASQSPQNAEFAVFANSDTNPAIAAFHSNPRLSFYSIGESLDLALLDTRVSTLMTDLAAAIP
jgi:hypothetical protein